MVSRQHGRGTFVRGDASPAVLIVEDDVQMRTMLRINVTAVGHRVLEASSPAEALEALETDSAIVLILSDVRIPTREAGIEFICTVRRRWPQLPLAAVTGYPDDLADLHGKPECPVLILPKPVWARQIEEALRLALGRHIVRGTALSGEAAR
jgi:CheY-like chemotaxis protein